jgi:hypothetical protein
LFGLYVVSAKTGSGKTVICAGLSGFLQAGGRKVGYLRLDDADDAAKIAGAYRRAAEGRDWLLAEGALSPAVGQAAGETGAKIIAVEAYADPPGDYPGLGEALLGVVLNKVPRSRLARVAAEAANRPVAVLGVMPEDRTLLALTVEELARSLGGKILNQAGKAAELVENYMLGAMVVDSGPSYFGRKSRKAVIVRGDRPDMQLAALETPTSCLVLSQARRPPVYQVMEKAEARGVPVIAVEQGTEAIVAGIEEAIAKSRFAAEKKMPRLGELVKEHLNLKAVLA